MDGFAQGRLECPREPAHTAFCSATLCSGYSKSAPAHTMPQHRWARGGHCSHGNLLHALTVVLIAVIIAAVVFRPSWAKQSGDWIASKLHRGRAGNSTKSRFEPVSGPKADLTEAPIDAITVGGNERAMGLASSNPIQRQSVYETLNRFYSTADVDPLITGQLYEFRDDTRDVYTGRTGVGGEWGLQEFTVDNQPAMIGVDIGPDALSEYEGSILGYDDGIPEQWAFPSTPFRWYRPRRADYLGPDGPALVDGDKAYSLFVPDHEPQIGEDTEFTPD